MTRPNILLIEAGQMAAFVLSVYAQGGQTKTPNLDALAAEGVVFENAYSNSPICCPSRASKFTGRLPSTHEVWGNGAEFRSELPTIMHFLRSEGYRCAVSGKCHFIGLMTGDSVKDEAIAEYYGPGVIARGSRKDRWKYVWTRNHDDLLFDMAADPRELNDLSGDPTHSEVKAELRGRLLGRYDVEAVTARAAVSKRTRTFLHNTLSTNDGYRWDYQPVFDAATAYVRGTNDPGTA